MNILVLNGPNLNLLGEREPEIYGTITLEDITRMLQAKALKSSPLPELRFDQSNHEGALIDRMQEERRWMQGLIINPGALTHYSYALRDAIAAVNKPTVEVHLSDLMKREDFRRVSVLEGLPNVIRIMGRGAQGYLDALSTLLSQPAA